MSKNILVICGLCTLITNPAKSSPEPTTTEANQKKTSNWIRQYVLRVDNSLKVTASELNVLLNLFYFSYTRSAITLQAQREGLQTLQTTWHTYQNIMQTRRNPSKDLPYQVDEKTYTNNTRLLFDLQRQHRAIGSAYSHILNMALNGQYLANTELVAGINQVRDDIRRSIAPILAHVQETLTSFLHTNGRVGNQFLDYIDQPADIAAKNFSITDYIWQLVPQLTMHPFVQADRLAINVSEEWWKVLYQLLTMSNAIWEALEKTRAELFFEYYRQLYTVAQSAGIHENTLNIIVDENGLIDETLRNQLLPNPTTITTH
jgi:hypothetical protein